LGVTGGEAKKEVEVRKGKGNGEVLVGDPDEKTSKWIDYLEKLETIVASTWSY